MLPQKKRKQRKVKNALVDIDCSAEPGMNYRNWIEITKQKLKVLLNDKFRLVTYKINEQRKETSYYGNRKLKKLNQ